MKYKQMNAELVQDKKSSDKIMQMKKHLLFNRLSENARLQERTKDLFYKIGTILKLSGKFQFFYLVILYISLSEKAFETARLVHGLLVLSYTVAGFIPIFSIFFKFHPIHINLNSARTFSRPRKRKFRYPTLNFRCPKIGSMIY